MDKKEIKTNDLEIPKFKLLLIGDASSGKFPIQSSIIPYSLDEGISNKCYTTIVFPEYGNIGIDIWNIPREPTLFPLYTRDAYVALLCVNANDKDNYKSLQEWLDLVNSNKTDKLKLIYIAATNCIEGCVTDPEIIHQIADEHGIPFFATRFDDDSIKKMFDKIANDLANTFQINKNTDDDNDAANKKKSCLIY